MTVTESQGGRDGCQIEVLTGAVSSKIYISDPQGIGNLRQDTIYEEVSEIYVEIDLDTVICYGYVWDRFTLQGGGSGDFCSYCGDGICTRHGGRREATS